MLSPKLRIRILICRFHSFHFFGVLGFLTGNGLGVFFANMLHLSPWVILLMGLTGAITFVLLTLIAKILTAKETIVYYHHEIAILTVCSLVLRALHLPVLPYLDITIIGIATFLAFGRIGCFSVGCCHGKPAKEGVVYGHEHVKAGFTPYFEGIPLFPIQLVESGIVFFIIGMTSILLLHRVATGTVLIVYTVLYGAFRFAIEFFRGDPERPYWKGLSEAQWTTLFLVTLSLCFAFAGYFPLYTWHIAITAALYVVSLFVSRKDTNHRNMFRPQHVRQIAAALNQPAVEQDMERSTYQAMVSVYQTRLGLRISKGQLINNGMAVPFYTVSFSENDLIDHRVVEKLAVLIKRLQKHSGPFQILEKQQKVFQICFTYPSVGHRH